MIRQLLTGALLLGLMGVCSASAVQYLFPPKCKCDRNPNNSPYRLRLSSMTITGSVNSICFTAYVVPCDTTQYCCVNQNLYKAEFSVGKFAVRAAAATAISRKPCTAKPRMLSQRKRS